MLFVGHFLPTEQLQYSQEVELKWAARRAGETNGEVATNSHARSMNLLLHGKLRFEVNASICPVLPVNRVSQ